MESIEILVTTTALDPIDTTSDMLVVFDRNTTVANGILKFPVNPRPKQSYYVFSKSQVTNVTIDSVKTVYDPITTAPPFFRAHWAFVPEADGGLGAWVRVG